MYYYSIFYLNMLFYVKVRITNPSKPIPYIIEIRLAFNQQGEFQIEFMYENTETTLTHRAYIFIE